MANTNLRFNCTPGLTLTLDLYPEGSDTATATGKTCTENTNAKGEYLCVISEAATGRNHAHIKSGTTVIAVFPTQNMADDTGVYWAADWVVDVMQWAGTTIPGVDTAGYPRVTIKDGTGTGEINTASGKVPATIAAGDMATDSITATALTTDAATKIFNSLSAGHTTVGGVGKLLADNIDATVSSRGTAAELAKVPKSDGNVTWNATALGSINAEADTALADYDPPTRAELTTDTNSILSKLLKYVQLLFRKDAAIATDNATELTAINADEGSGAGGASNQTDSLEANRDNIGTAGANLTVTAGTVSDKTGYSISGTLTTLDALDTAQDTQHGTTQTYLTTNLGTAGAAATEAGGTGDQFTALGDTRIANLDATVSSRSTVAAILAGIVDGAVSLKTAIRRILASAAGTSSGNEGASPIYKSPAGTKNRLQVTADEDGNRTSITYDDTDE